MIRFIIKKRHKNVDICPCEDFITLDLEVPKLEEQLRAGGYSQHFYEIYDLVGVELLDSENQTKEVEK